MFFEVAAFGLGLIVIPLIGIGIRKVPHKEEHLVERFGKYDRKLSSGLNLIVPVIDSVAHRVTLKTQAISVPHQEAITSDNIRVTVSGTIYLTITDTEKASYNVDDCIFAVTNLAQTVMRSAIGEMDLDSTIKSRAILNTKIVQEVSERAAMWGVAVQMYELNEVTPPKSVIGAMEKQMESERNKRAAILNAEGQRQSEITIAEGKKAAQVLSAEAEKESKILAAEAEKQESILRAEGNATATRLEADATAEALRSVGQTIATGDGKLAASFEVMKQAIDAKANIAKKSTLVMLSEKQSDPSETVAQAIATASAMQSSQVWN